jgi:hypothetical protein
VVGAEAAQLALAVADLAVELVDQSQAGVDRALPRLRQPEPGEQLAAADAEEIGSGNRNDVTQLVELLDRVPPVRGRVGRPGRRPKTVIASRLRGVARVPATRER